MCRALLLVVFGFRAVISMAQWYKPENEHFLAAFPVAFYLPETNWGFGARGIYSFHLGRADSLASSSQIQLGGVYSLNRQWYASLPFDLNWRHRQQRLSGELGFYNYSYRFYGIGHMVPNTYSEPYREKFLQARANYLHRMRKNWYGGVRYWFETRQTLRTESGGMLAADTISGAMGSTVSGPGLVLLYDSRDNLLSARSGWYMECVWHTQGPLWGSRFWFDRYRFDLRKYLPISGKQILAFQLFGDFLAGDVPWAQLAAIGSAKRMRGYLEGMVRDKALALIQAEYRMDMLKNLGVTGFAHVAWSGTEPGDLGRHTTHRAAGVGLRYTLDRTQRLKLRLDFAYSPRASAWYFTVGEAF